MAVTSTFSNSKGVANVAVGRYLDTGTAAAFTLTIGFQPRYVRVQNLAATGSLAEWYEGMADAEAVKRVTAGDMTVITSLGITPVARGFTVGLDTDLNVTSEQLSFLALG